MHYIIVNPLMMKVATGNFSGECWVAGEAGETRVRASWRAGLRVRLRAGLPRSRNSGHRLEHRHSQLGHNDGDDALINRVFFTCLQVDLCHALPFLLVTTMSPIELCN